MFNYNKLKGRIVEEYGNINQFFLANEETLNCTYATITNKLKGVTGFTQEEIVLWASILKIKPSEIFEYFFM